MIKQLVIFAALVVGIQASTRFKLRCNNNGYLGDDGKTCMCDNPFPTVPGTKGWLGEDCEVPIYPGSVDGEDMAAPCASTDKCNFLPESAWVCFAIPPAENDTSRHSWTFLMNRVDGDGDPDLHAFSRLAPPPKFVGLQGPWEFQDTSSTTPYARLTISKAGLPEGHFSKGIVVCGHNYYGYGSLKYSLKAVDDCQVSAEEEVTSVVGSNPRVNVDVKTA